MIGRSGTSSEKSLRTRIFSPPEGTLMCWYAIWNALPAEEGRKRGAIITAFERRRRLICTRFLRARELLSTGRKPARYSVRTAPKAGLSFTTREGDDDEAACCSPRRGDVRGHQLCRARAGQRHGKEVE